jgi:uncharacterized protein (DUF2235 family)
MPKNIVICCDGTNNEVVGDQTNVLRLFRMVIRDETQMTFYDAGVGTKADPTAQWPWRRFARKRLDSAIGVSVRAHVLEGYRFLMDHYVADDRVFLFGFSRGAYTVRALAGMIKRCGLLHPEYANLADYAWAVFTDEDRSGDRRSLFGGPARIKKVFGREAEVHFLGAWDTVSSFGWMWDLLTIPNTATNDIIRHVRHAVSIDEKRRCFQPNHFRPPTGQDCKEVWFAGVHADVGGGYPDEEAGLARIALEWMVREAKSCGLAVDQLRESEMFRRMGDESIPHALAKQHDESIRPAWRLIGWLPRRAFDSARDESVWTWPNWAAARKIGENALIHQSVETRISNPMLNYRPNLPEKYTFVS